MSPAGTHGRVHIGVNPLPATVAAQSHERCLVLSSTPHPLPAASISPSAQARQGGTSTLARPPRLLIPSVSGTGFPYEKVVQRVLYLQVLDYDRFSRNDPIGEVSIPLNKVDLTQMQTFWKDLKPCTDGSVRLRSPSHALGTVLEGRLPSVGPSPSCYPSQGVFCLVGRFCTQWGGLFSQVFVNSSPMSHFGSKQAVPGRSIMKVFSLQQDQKKSRWGGLFPPALIFCAAPKSPLRTAWGGPSPAPRPQEGALGAPSGLWWGAGAFGAPTEEPLWVPQGSRGELLLSLCYNPSANSIVVNIIKARNLKAMDIGGTSGTSSGSHRTGRPCPRPSRG